MECALRNGSLQQGLGPFSLRVAWVLLSLALPASAEQGEIAPAQRSVRLLRIQLPLVGNADRLYQSRLQRAVQLLTKTKETAEGEGRRPLLVLEFVPAPEGGATEFERAFSLARYLVSPSMASVKTLAYLPSSLDGHAVLAALACEEIAMAPDAEIGPATKEKEASGPLEPGIRASYAQIAGTRRTAPPAIAMAMVDPAAELLRVETDRGDRYTLRKDLESLEAESTVAGEEVLSPAGSLAIFTGRTGREIGFIKYLAADRASLARTLGVPAGSLQEDQAFIDSWRPVMIDLDGPLTTSMARRLETLIGTELDGQGPNGQQGVNWIGVRINSSSGDWSAAMQLAQTLAELSRGDARTVAYVPRRAEGPAALVALACEQLVLQEGATLGGGLEAMEAAPKEGFEWLDDAKEGGAEEVEEEAPEERPGRRLRNRVENQEKQQEKNAGALAPILTTLQKTLAPATKRSWSLLAAVVDPSLEVHLYSNRQTAEVRAMGPAELAEQPDRADWRRGERIVAAGERLSLSSKRAEELGIAWHVVEQFDDLASLYGFTEPPRTAHPNWALELIEALGSPGFAAMLLIICVLGVYVELSTPGLGIGGFIAAVAMLLFFWSKFLNGTADWLEVMLFVTGVVFVLLELLVLPGFGIFGLGGGLLIVAALVLASQTFILPQTELQLIELRNSLSVVAGSGVICLGLGMVLRQYLPHSPIFRRAMLMPPDEADQIEQDRREAIADYAHLVGQTGTATTDLMPSGRAEIAGELVDVTAGGEMIDRGTPVVVVKAQANHVVVKQVRG